MDVLKKSPKSIMQNLVQIIEDARYAMANIQQDFMDMSERKSKRIIERMIAQIHQMENVRCATVNTGGNVISMCMVPVNLKYSHSGKTVKTMHYLIDAVKKQLC